MVKRTAAHADPELSAEEMSSAGAPPAVSSSEADPADPKVRIAWTRVRELDAKVAGAKHKRRTLKDQINKMQRQVDQLVDGDTDPAELDQLEEKLATVKARRTQAGYRLRALREEAARAREQAQLLDVAALAAIAPAAEIREEGSGGEEPPRVRLRFASLPLFVESYVLPNWRHPLSGGVAWCARWWEHAEAISRLSACWEAFEVMRQEPAPALSVWWRDHLDVHMAALTRESGPFKQCDAARGSHKAQPVWANVQPPAGLFPIDDEAEIGGRGSTLAFETKEAS
ncbi:DUF4913 domain-containing protein [Yimella sp. cx-51]|uniref:DUF4913 domain-containing protein n=1 Tax=Yimella sp. cx-51 TaxID=2770551 RepID=UPI001CB6FF4C|nr:DUF4913 domain-containing protein [Yimella sp. cx-51]